MATHTVGGMINGAFSLIRINDETSTAEWSTNGSAWTPIASGGSGDMEKSVYDTNDDGVVNSADRATTAGSAETASHATTAGSAETANAIGTASSTDVENAVANSHTHSNKTTLDKFGELSGAATFDGEPISGLPTASNDTPFLAWDVTNRGNDSNTKFLLQPIDSTGEIADTARGATAPAIITNSGSVSVNASGELVFDGTNYLEIPANALPNDIFIADNEWMFDIEFSCNDSTTIRYVFGRSDRNRIDLCIKNGYLASGLIDNFAPFSGGNALVTYEYFYDDTQSNWVFAAYVNGNLKSTRLGQLVDYRKYPIRIGWTIDSGGRPGLDGTISMVRICNNAPYRGKSFTPTPRPYLEPLTGWAAKTVSQMRGILGLPDFVQQNISTHNAAPTAHPDKAGIPDYSSGTMIDSTVTSDAGYTFTANGWVLLAPSSGNIYLNNAQIQMVSGSVVLPVASGDVLKIVTQSGDVPGEAVFYPNRQGGGVSVDPVGALFFTTTQKEGTSGAGYIFSGTGTLQMELATGEIAELSLTDTTQRAFSAYELSNVNVVSGGENITWVSLGGIGVDYIDLAICKNVEHLGLSSSSSPQLANLSKCNMLKYLRVRESGLTSEQIDQILADVLASNSNLNYESFSGYIDVSHNAVPTAAGLETIAQLKSVGWTVSYDSK